MKERTKFFLFQLKVFLGLEAQFILFVYCYIMEENYNGSSFKINCPIQSSWNVDHKGKNDNSDLDEVK